MARARAAAATADYSARHLTVLEGLDAVRKRPGMYIGSTDTRGLMHCLWELIDNAVDEALGGHAAQVIVTLHPDGSATVADDGRGIPVDIEPRTKLSGVEVVLTRLHAGGKFGGGSYTASGGLHGVGASVVNALAARLDVAVDRDMRTHSLSFRRGVPGVFDEPGPDAPFRKRSGLQVAGKVKRGVTGTRVTFWPDREIFTADADFDVDGLHERARQTAYLVPSMALTIRDERSDAEPMTYSFSGGIAEFAETASADPAVTPVVRVAGVGHFHETVPVLDDAGHLTSTDVERELHVDIALRWGTGYDSVVRSFVNVIATPKGGTHVTGFERGIVKAANEALRAAKVLRTGEDNVTKDDICEGLTAIIAIRVPEPQFEGQTKEVLGTPAATRIVSHVVHKQLLSWFTNPPRGAKLPARAALDKIAAAARSRLAARAHRDLQRRKNALENSSLPVKLKDCHSESVDETELFIVEGDSALGTAKLARNAEYQALLPIRGKILNTQRASATEMLSNTECAAIIQVIGSGSGRTFDLDAARYGRVIIMTDADVDGAHIRCLLLTLFHRHLHPLLAAGRVFAAVPPLHRFDVYARGGSKAETIYTYSEEEYRATSKRLQHEGRRIKDPVQRYKGLGEMDADQLRDTTMNPATRTLRRITAPDAEVAASVFELLMGKEVEPRREFITSSAAELDRSRVDA